MEEGAQRGAISVPVHVSAFADGVDTNFVDVAAAVLEEMWKERWWNLNELIVNERLEEEPAVDETTNTKEGEVEVLVYLPW